jgi:hypothetical protein
VVVVVLPGPGAPKAAGLVAVACWTLAMSAAVAQEKPAENQAGPIAGAVADRGGQPAAGTRVWLLGGAWDEPPNGKASRSSSMQATP